MKTLLSLVLLTLTLPAVAAKWRPLWDGKTFHGWHIIGSGQWEIADDAIHGTHAKDDKKFGHLVTDATYQDFALRLKFKATKGNSGLYFRIEEKGHSGVSGFQAEIDAAQDVGGLYETNGRGWVVKPKPEEVRKWFKPGKWNKMEIVARGGNIVVKVNGQKTAERTNDSGRAEGKIALQVHANQDCDLWFKDIEMAE